MSGVLIVAGVVHPRVMLVPLVVGRLQLRVLRIARLGGSNGAMTGMTRTVFYKALKR